jgi:chemotaxis signal transduction protein
MSQASDMRLNLLLFKVGGVCFGCDSDQVAGVAHLTGDDGDDLFWFHEELGFPREVAYLAPATVTVRTGGCPYRVIIDQMEEIAEFDVSSLRLLPLLLEPFALRRGIWGILQSNQRLFLLVDFRLLLKNKHQKSRDPATKMEQGDAE